MKAFFSFLIDAFGVMSMISFFVHAYRWQSGYQIEHGIDALIYGIYSVLFTLWGARK
jgi:hypothetical protein